MRAAVLTFSPQAGELAKKFFESYDLYGKSFGNNVRKEDFRDLIDRYDAFIFIGAVGIAVRYMAPHVADKRYDPAVVVIDPLGRYVIPILSGHLGGANAMTRDIAENIGAEAIVTTASDALGFTSIDVFAKEHGLVIGDMVRMREVAAKMVAGEPLYYYTKTQDIPDYKPLHRVPLPKDADVHGGVVVSQRCLDLKHGLQLIPQRIHIGIGSKKGTDGDDLLRLIDSTFQELAIDLRAIKAAHTIDIKKDEPSILRACHALNLPLIVHSAKELATKEDRCQGSDFVKKTVGVKAVSCPAALMGGERIIVEKRVYNGCTISVTEELE